ncbi:hypothetical protein KP509_02G028100 [Ceratopteris richardii]|uniref:Terpene synthase n=1 Tax=Ceratopteris richardii TaxID=49495 RepID=A0A8T2V457_CERRI|nr:hypothetical protein KP509_02G028100 [Ceratopteris richardii]
MDLTADNQKSASAVKADGQFPSAENGGAEELGVLGEVHNIVIPPIPCSFPWRNHPDYKALTEMSDAWVLANFTNLPGADGRPSSFAAEHMIKSAFHMQATLPFADGISERMPPIIKMMDWYFMIDNILDDPSEMGADPERADKVVDSVLTVFRDTYVHPCPSPSPLVRILTDTAAEWWAEMCVGMPPKQKARLSKAFCDYLEANRMQVPYRNSRQLPDLETYLQVREDSIGWWPCAVLIEHCQGFELDDEALSHPLMVELQKNTVQHIFMTNDITSFKKEYMQGDFCNIVSILYFRKLYDPKRDPQSPAPTLQGAVLEAIEMIRERDENAVKLMEQIRNCPKLISKPGVEQYLEGLGLWISGTIYWHLASGRYGICATTNLHETPPDMLVAHQLNIDVNKEAASTLPSGVMMSTAC